MPALIDRLQRWVLDAQSARVAEIVAPHVRGSLLDVGCGNGTVTALLPAVHKVGIDVIDPPRPVVPVRRFDGVHIPFDDNAFDTIVCTFVLHHADDLPALVREMKRVARRFVILEDDVSDPVHRGSVLAMHQLMVWIDRMPYQADAFRTTEGWRRFFTGHGLSLLKQRTVAGVHPFWPFLRHHLFVLERAEPA